MSRSISGIGIEAEPNQDAQIWLIERVKKFCGCFGRCFFVSLALRFVSLTGVCEAQQLQWDSTELAFSPSPADKIVVAHFKFKNAGNADAKIISVESSCSCTTLTLAKKNFAPEETGEITATFTIGVRTGLQNKVILVASNDIKRPTTVLRMTVAIPEVAQLRPTFLYWPPTEPLAPKEIGVKILNGFPVKTITVESSNPKIAAKVEAVKPGQEYKIVVTPSETDQPVMTILSIKTDYPPENPKTFFANVRLQPKTK